MIKLSELIVKPQNITPEKVDQYIIDNIWNNNNEFGNYSSIGWIEYDKLCEPYIKIIKHPAFLYKLSQSELNKFYKDIRALVRKHVGKETLSKLQIKSQNITPEKAFQYYINNIPNNIGNKDWKKYEKLCKPYCEKYGILWFLATLHEFKKLSQQDLNKIYKEMRALVRKHVGKERLNEVKISYFLSRIPKEWKLKTKKNTIYSFEHYLEKFKDVDILDIIKINDKYKINLMLAGIDNYEDDRTAVYYDTIEQALTQAINIMEDSTWI